MAELSFQDALNKARGLKNFYKAFESLEEVLDAAVKADRAVKARQKELPPLDEAIQKKKAAISELEHDAHMRRKKLEDDLAKLKAQYTSENNTLIEKQKALKSRFAEEAKRLNDGLEERRALIASELETLDADLASRKDQLIKANRRLEDLRKAVR